MKSLSKITASLKERAAKLKKNIPVLFLALKRKETPISAKLLAFLTVAYALSPIDLIPDFIPILGYLDDILLLPILVVLTMKLIPPQIIQEVQAEAEGMWQDGKPKKWYYSIPIILFWLLIIAVLIKLIWY